MRYQYKRDAITLLIDEKLGSEQQIFDFIFTSVVSRIYANGSHFSIIFLFRCGAYNHHRNFIKLIDQVSLSFSLADTDLNI